MNRTTYDPEKFNLDIASLKKSGFNFEVVVDPDKAILFREQKESSNVDISDVIKYEKIFADAQRGQLANEAKFLNFFGTEDKLKIAEIILKEGEIKLTAEHRKKQIEKKRAQIITLIQKRGVDPRTGIPHTLVRIEDSLIAAKVHIDEFKSVEEQSKDIIKKLRPIIPISFEIKKIEIFVDTKYSHQVYGYLKKSYKILRNSWGGDQSWTGIVEIPAGLELDFYDTLNSMTHGSVNIKVLSE